MIAALWARFYGWFLGALAVLAAVAGVYLKGRSAGKQVEQKKATQRDLTEAKEHAETIRETVDVESNIIRMPDSAVRERLRKYTRDN
jgi:uncharacterized membrane-anchored protein YhcB (DUF1043 family)